MAGQGIPGPTFRRRSTEILTSAPITPSMSSFTPRTLPIPCGEAVRTQRSIGGTPMRHSFMLLLFACLSLVATACGGDGEGGSAVVRECEPADACSCGPGVDRPTACTCNGGSSCEIEGDDIEFQCQGNAACGMTCGTDCLITCPGTTSCSVDVDDGGIVSCPGTATCEVICRGDCTVEMTGTARSTLRCEAEDATCEVTGCDVTDCGDGVFACRMDCPSAGD